MVILTPILKMLGSMALSLITGPMIKRLFIMGLELAVGKYERKAAKTEDKEDDAQAESFRKLLEEAKKQWESL